MLTIIIEQRDNKREANKRELKELRDICIISERLFTFYRTSRKRNTTPDYTGREEKRKITNKRKEDEM
jgi:hypothetical protein